MLLRIRLLFLFSLVVFSLNSQVNVDSLKQVFEDPNTHDTTKIKTLFYINVSTYIFNDPDTAFFIAQIQWEMANRLEKREPSLKNFCQMQKADALNIQGVSFDIRGRPKEALEYYNRCLKIQREVGDLRGEASTLLNVGIIYDTQGDYDMAIKTYERSLEVYESIGDSTGMAKSYLNLGNIYNVKGDFKAGIDLYMKSLKIAESRGNLKEVASAYNNIGIVYKNVGDYDNAMSNYQKSLQIYKQYKLKQGIASAYENIGTLYSKKNMPDSALYYHQESLRLKKESEDVQSMPVSLQNIAAYYVEKGEYEEALKHYQEALDIASQLQDPKLRSDILTGISNVYFETREYDKALKLAEEAAQIAQKYDFLKELNGASEVLYKVYDKKNDPTHAYAFFQIYISTRDSLKRAEIKDELIRQKYQYKYEKKALKDSIKHEEQQKLAQAEFEAENEKKKQQMIYLFIILGLVLVGAVFIYRRFRISQKQKSIIEKQKKEVDSAYDQLEEKNTEIMDSITYAKRIQSAILPRDSKIKEHLPNSFVLYKPKDIVAGDFYWMEIISTNDCSPPFQGGAVTEPVECIREAGGGFVSGKPKMNSEHLSENRKNLRSNMTQAEAFLWDKLKNSQFEGRKFRRQHSIDNYIVDFYCASEKLVIELDGEVHNIEEQAKADQERNQRLKQYGITVLRFENHLVFDNYELVADRIREHFRNSTIDRHSDHPDLVSSATPPFKGGEQSLVLIAAADCTGHGVPGAMVSVVCNNGLNRSVREYGLTDPGKILDKTRELVIEEFEKSDSNSHNDDSTTDEIKDGMDIALVALAQSELESESEEVNPHSHTSHSLCYSGAHNPLWIIRKGSNEIEEIKAEFSAETSDRINVYSKDCHTIIEVKADKQPIGKFDNPQPYTTHKVELKPGDTFYIFSDGYPDQFGGEKGKKLKSKGFKEILLSIQDKSMEEQKELLDEKFEKWKSGFEQLDDVCVIGVRL